MEKRLPYLEFTENGEVRYLGYLLPLTQGERELLRAIFASDVCVDKEKILKEVPSGIKLSPGSIPVHVASINKKAVALGKRKLINYKRRQGYCIAEDI